MLWNIWLFNFFIIFNNQNIKSYFTTTFSNLVKVMKNFLFNYNYLIIYKGLNLWNSLQVFYNTLNVWSTCYCISKAFMVITYRIYYCFSCCCFSYCYLFLFFLSNQENLYTIVYNLCLFGDICNTFYWYYQKQNRPFPLIFLYPFDIYKELN